MNKINMKDFWVFFSLCIATTLLSAYVYATATIEKKFQENLFNVIMDASSDVDREEPNTTVIKCVSTSFDGEYMKCITEDSVCYFKDENKVFCKEKPV